MVDGDERAPTPSVAAIGGAAGAVWGLLCYSILWHGEPVGVQPPFFESLGGTLALLPARAVLWAIHVAEELAGRPFALADDHWWIGVAAAVVGGAAVALASIGGRAALGSLRRRRRNGSIPA